MALRRNRPQDGAEWRGRVHDVIFEADTPAGKAFDVALLCAILASVAVVMLDSVPALGERHGTLFIALEWTFTILFTVEYGLRLASVHRRREYALSFFGIIDLLSVLPTYLTVILPGGQVLVVIRILRVLRVFRVLKLVQYVGEAGALMSALRASRFKIAVFMVAVVSVAVIVGSMMYLIEGPASGFTSIPRGVYWAIVTMSTVGYGNLTPSSPPGQFLAAVLMIIGYGIIAVPTGIVSVEMARASDAQDRLLNSQSGGGSACPYCQRTGHDPDAEWCKYCGESLTDSDEPNT